MVAAFMSTLSFLVLLLVAAEAASLIVLILSLAALFVSFASIGVVRWNGESDCDSKCERKRASFTAPNGRLL